MSSFNGHYVFKSESEGIKRKQPEENGEALDKKRKGAMYKWSKIDEGSTDNMTSTDRVVEFLLNDNGQEFVYCIQRDSINEKKVKKATKTSIANRCLDYFKERNVFHRNFDDLRKQIGDICKKFTKTLEYLVEGENNSEFPSGHELELVLNEKCPRFRDFETCLKKAEKEGRIVLNKDGTLQQPETIVLDDKPKGKQKQQCLFEETIEVNADHTEEALPLVATSSANSKPDDIPFIPNLTDEMKNYIEKRVQADVRVQLAKINLEREKFRAEKLLEIQDHFLKYINDGVQPPFAKLVVEQEIEQFIGVIKNQ